MSNDYPAPRQRKPHLHGPHFDPECIDCQAVEKARAADLAARAVEPDDGADYITGALPDSTDAETNEVQVDSVEEWYEPSEEQRRAMKRAGELLHEAVHIARTAFGKYPHETHATACNVVVALADQFANAGQRGIQWPRRK